MRRGRGTLVLAKTLGSLGGTKLSAEAVQLLVSFLLDRLSDPTTAGELLEALLTLVQLQDLTPAQAIQMCSAVLQLSMHAFPHNVRNGAYRVINALLEKHEAGTPISCMF